MTNQFFAGHNAFEQWLYDVEAFTTTVHGNVDDPGSFTADPITATTVLERTSPGNQIYAHQHANPPLDESGIVAWRKDLAIALCADIVENAKALSRRRLGALEDAREVARLIDIARHVLP